MSKLRPILCLSKSEKYKIRLHHLLLENLRFRILALTVGSLLGPDVGGDLEDVPHQDQDPLQDELVILQPLVPVFPQQVAKKKNVSLTQLHLLLVF